jgi:hypothetical protein
MKCAACEDVGWVCEEHPVAPWDEAHGLPCPKCNPADLENPPRPPAGTRVEFDKNGWRH